MKNFSFTKKGFTLVELIIVVMILGILLSISIITLVNVVQSGQSKSTKIMAKKIQNAINIYITETNDKDLSHVLMQIQS